MSVIIFRIPRQFCSAKSDGCGIVGTAGLNVPMFIALRRFALLCTLILERVMMHKSHDKATAGSVAVMIVGKMLFKLPTGILNPSSLSRC